MRNFFEGWYFKHQNKENTICFIPGISNENAFIQVITNEKSYNINFDKQEFKKDEIVKIQNNIFSFDGLEININTPELNLKSKINYKNLTPLKSDVMGPFRFFPMQCRHGIVSMHHNLSGYVQLNNAYFNFNDGVGYIEKDSGKSFPKNYVWVQSNDFDEKCSVMISIADIPFLGFEFRGFICSVWYKEKEYRMATYNGAKVVSCTKNMIIIESKKCKLEAYIFEDNSYMLYAPNTGKMTRTIKETPSCKAKFKFFYDSKLLFDFESPKTSFEFVNK